MENPTNPESPDQSGVEDLEEFLKAHALIERAKVKPTGAGLVIYATPNLSELRRARTGRLRDLLRVTVHEAARATGLEAAHGQVEVIYWPSDNRSHESQLVPECRNSVSSDVMEWLKKRFPGCDVSIGSVLDLDLGLDSIDRTILYLEIEEKFGLYIPEELCDEIMTIGDLIRSVSVIQPERVSTKRGFNAPETLLTPFHRKWLKPRRTIEFWWARIIYAVNRAIVCSYFRMEIKGRQYLPESGPALIAVNHVSDLDHFVVAAAMDWKRLKQVHWAGDKYRLFCSALRRLASRAGGVLPADDYAAGGTLASCLLALRRGAILVMFPEGWRSPDGNLQPFARGIGLLAYHANLPIIPAVVTGTFEAMPRSARFPRPRKLTLEIRPAIEFDRNSLAADASEGYSFIARRLQCEMNTLLGQKQT